MRPGGRRGAARGVGGGERAAGVRGIGLKSWTAGLLVSLSAGCASWNAPPGDPLQPINKPIFRFNVAADDYVIGPMARGYKFITPQLFRTGVTNFFFNTKFPRRFVSSVGQLKGGKAASEVGRFLVNTTVGMGGLFDVASDMGMQRYDEDIGQMFGYWGIPGGPYWVIPILGPSNPRDTAGIVAEIFLSPFFWIARAVEGPYFIGAAALDNLNRRAELDEELAAFRRSALDYYVAVRDAYLARREAQIADEDPDAKADEPDDDLYDFEDEPAPGGELFDEEVP